MAANVKIKDLAPGEFFNIGPTDALILEHFSYGETLLVTKEPIGDRPFFVLPFKYRRKSDQNPNDFYYSSIRRDLNNDFLSDVDDGGVIPAWKISNTTWDLSDHLGEAAYGEITCKIGLLSPDQYEKYIDAGLLPKEYWDGWEWTITPYADSANNVSTVNPEGLLSNSNSRVCTNGVRPAFVVDSEIILPLKEDDLADSNPLAQYTSRQLMKEVLRRISAGEDK